MTPTVRAWLLWTASFVAFPLGGIAGRHADSLTTALLGGLITGAITVSALLGLLLQHTVPVPTRTEVTA